MTDPSPNESAREIRMTGSRAPPAPQLVGNLGGGQGRDRRGVPHPRLAGDVRLRNTQTGVDGLPSRGICVRFSHGRQTSDRSQHHAPDDRDCRAPRRHARRGLYRHHARGRGLPHRSQGAGWRALRLSAAHLGLARHPGECRSGRADRSAHRARSPRAGECGLGARHRGTGRHAGPRQSHVERGVPARPGRRRKASRSAPGRASIWPNTARGRIAAR